ncbi:MAG: diguanylate cyclase, partial [Xanthomonadales bacterium]|nr:diguanylate cyclase [Xanthomonadales bacterium]
MAGIVLGLVCLIGIVLLVFYWRGYELLTDRERAQASSAALRLAGELGQHLALAEGLAASLANLGEVLPPDAALWQRSLPHVLDLEARDSLIAGGGLWPEPGAFAPDVERSSFFWGRDANGRLQFFDDYNATDGPGYHREEWYVPARHQQPGRCYWSRSYQDPYTAEPMVTCSVPMFGARGRFTGVSTVDLRLSGLQKFVTERGRSLRGYAMMVDRNGTFITLPGASEHGQSARLGESLSIATLAQEMDTLAPMAAFLARAAETAGPVDETLARRISEAADRIPLDEARRVVAQLHTSEADAAEVSQAVFDKDPFLGEPVLVTALRLGGTHWQLVVVQPRRLVHEAVESVLTPVAIYLVLAIGLVALVAAWLVRRILVDPIRRMAEQVRQAELAPDAASRIAVPGKDELGQLALAFNLRAERLAQSHARLQASAEQFRSVTALAHDALIQVDEQGLIRTVNPAGERMFGVSEGQLQGHSLQQLLPWSPAADGDGAGDRSGGQSRAATRMRLLNATRPGGSSFPAEVSASYWQGPDGGLYNVQVRDITERRRAEEQVKLLATHDTLTGLPNRVLFQDRLQQAIKQCQRNRRPLGLLFLDLDNFKLANDSLGHAIGDSLLRAVSERLLACVSNEGSVARLGGDEFVV